MGTRLNFSKRLIPARSMPRSLPFPLSIQTFTWRKSSETGSWCVSAPTHALATKAYIQPADLQENLKILYQPQRHPHAHARLLELLGDAGVKVEAYSRASHPTEMQALVKQGYGFALIREGSHLDGELTTRPVAGVDWTVDTAFIYRKQGYPRTIPILIRILKSRLTRQPNPTKKPPRSVGKEPQQMSLLG
jgi:hypothetical protein